MIEKIKEKIKQNLRPIHDKTVSIVERQLSKASIFRVILSLILLVIFLNQNTITAVLTDGSNLGKIEKMIFDYDPSDYIFDHAIDNLKILIYILIAGIAVWHSVNTYFKRKLSLLQAVYIETTLFLLILIANSAHNSLLKLPAGFLFSIVLSLIILYFGARMILKGLRLTKYLEIIGVNLFAGSIITIAILAGFFAYVYLDVGLVRANQDFATNYEVFNHSDGSFSVLYNSTITDNKTKELRVMKVCEVRFPEGWQIASNNETKKMIGRHWDYSLFYKPTLKDNYDQYLIFYYGPPGGGFLEQCKFPEYPESDESLKGRYVIENISSLLFENKKALACLDKGYDINKTAIIYNVDYTDAGGSGYRANYGVLLNQKQDLDYIINNTNCYKKTDGSLITKLFLE